jgi:CO/xanthine dehydrogenase Mo-binding subunit
MLEAAAEELEVDAEDLETDGTGFIKLKGSEEKKIHIVDLALAAHFKLGPDDRGARDLPQGALLSGARDGQDDPDSCQAHACTVADVEVDDETGVVEVLAMHNVYEVGRAINPAMAKQQIEGGAWMGDLARAVRGDRAVLPGARPRARGTSRST